MLINRGPCFAVLRLRPQYSLQANGVSQNVSVDKNVVSFHIVKNGIEAWIVQDFDKVGVDKLYLFNY
jgi:hypothetical protein